MKKRGAAKAVSLRATVIVLVVLVLTIALGFLMVFKVNFLVGRSLQVVFGNADSTYRGAWFELDGDLVARDFVLRPYGADYDATLTFKRIHVETPGWSWVLGNLLGDRVVANLDHLRVTLSEGTSDDGVDPTLGDLGPFGTDTASPFEAEGCLQDNVWLRSELVEMGLDPGPTTLEYDYRIDNLQLTTRIMLATPGVSRVILERHDQTPSRTNPFLLDITQTLTRDERWEVQDEGFVKARNAYCAKKDGTDDAQFVARHVDSVKRLLATQGLALDEASLAMYADFARNGGQLSFGGNYVTPLLSDIFYEARSSGAAFTQMHGIFGRGGKKVAAQWTQSAPRPLAGMAEGLPTYAALVNERGAAGSPPGATLAAASALAPVVVAAPVASTVVEVAPVKAAAQVQAPPAIPAAAKAPAAAVASAKRGDELAWQVLPKYIGRDFEMWTGRSPPRTVTLTEASPSEIRVETRVGGGHVQYRINKDSFIRAVLLR